MANLCCAQSDKVQTTFDKIERLDYHLPESVSPQARDLIRLVLQRVCHAPQTPPPTPSRDTRAVSLWMSV
jgi:hypothetical protein